MLFRSIIPSKYRDELEKTGKRIRTNEMTIRSIENKHKNQFKSLRKNQKKWIKLQGKETEYEVDVELDQIVTFHRVSLANLFSYFIKHFLGGEPMSMVSLLHRIIHLQAIVEETKQIRKVKFQYNNKDKNIMNRLIPGLKKINALKIHGINGKLIEFVME